MIPTMEASWPDALETGAVHAPRRARFGLGLDIALAEVVHAGADMLEALDAYRREPLGAANRAMAARAARGWVTACRSMAAAIDVEMGDAS